MAEPNIIYQTNRIMRKCLIAFSVSSIRMMKKAVPSNRRSQSKTLNQRKHIEMAAKVRYRSIVSSWSKRFMKRTRRFRRRYVRSFMFQ